ncbi:MAG: exosome complex exonuclease Rrp41, partial [Candidatus Heimdallarchaeota archaeon]|nr:exosome complex exonuclease Rrp41 [Candidatus Heimdallarchaeota archaeon]
DLSDVEDKEGQGDMPVAMNYNTGEISLLQCDGEFTPDEIKEGLNLANNAIGTVYQMQRKALLSKYSQIEESHDESQDEEE